MKKSNLKFSFLIKQCLFFLALFSIMLLMNSCEDNFRSENELDQNSVIGILMEMGFKHNDIVELDDFYVVEGDMLFSKNIDDYDEDTNTEARPRQRRKGTLVSQTNVTSMSVYIDSSIPTTAPDNWRSAIGLAIWDWNNTLGASKVHFMISKSSSADITISSDSGIFPNTQIAGALQPSTNQPGNTLLINLDYDGDKTVTESSKRYNIAHELGHTIGLHHTNETEILIPSTPISDPNSVMNGGTADDEWGGFSYFDGIAVWMLYPEDATISATVKNSGIFIRGGMNNFHVNNVPQYASFQWTFSSGITVIYGGTTQNYLHLTSSNPAGTSGWVKVTVTYPSSSGIAPYIEQVNFQFQ